MKGGYVRVAVQACEVLAIDQYVTLDPVTSTPGPVLNESGHPTVLWFTLAVTHNEAENIVHAEIYKRPLELLLRQQNDMDIVETTGADKVALLGEDFIERYLGHRALFGADVSVEKFNENNMTILNTPPY